MKIKKVYLNFGKREVMDKGCYRSNPISSVGTRMERKTPRGGIEEEVVRQLGGRVPLPIPSPLLSLALIGAISNSFTGGVSNSFMSGWPDNRWSNDIFRIDSHNIWMDTVLKVKRIIECCC